MHFFELLFTSIYDLVKKLKFMSSGKLEIKLYEKKLYISAFNAENFMKIE